MDRRNLQAAPDRLPKYVLEHIFARLKPTQLAHCCLVCFDWYDIITGESSIWQEICQRQKARLQQASLNPDPTASAQSQPPAQFLQASDRPHLSSKRSGGSREDSRSPAGSSRGSSGGNQSSPSSQQTLNSRVQDWERKEGYHSSRPSSGKGGDVGEDPADWRRLAVDAEQRARFHGGRVSLQVLEGHSARVNCCSLHGGVIASGASDETIRLWSRASGKSLATLRVPAGAPVVDVDFDESKVVAAAGTEVFVFKRSTGRLMRRIGGHFQRVRTMRWEDAEVMAGCHDGTVRVFDLYSSKCSQIMRPHSSAVTGVALAGPLRLLASGSKDGTVHVAHLDSCRPVASLLSPNPMEGVECVHLAADGYTLTAGTAAGRLHRWDLRSPKHQLAKLKLYGNALTALDSPLYAPSTLVTAGLTGVLHVLDGTSCTPLRSLARPSALRAGCPAVVVVPSAPLVDFSNQPVRGLDSDHQSIASADLDTQPMGRERLRSGQAGGATASGNAQRQPRFSTAVSCVKAGMTSAVAGEADGKLSVWRFESYP